MKVPLSSLAVGMAVSCGIKPTAGRQLPSSFVVPLLQSSSSSSSSRVSTTHPLFMAPPPTPTLQEIEAESEKLRKEIEELRAEALRRLKALDEQLSSATSSGSLDVSSEQPTLAGKDEEGLLPAPAPIVFTKSANSSADPNPNVAKKSVKKGINNLLDETRWKINLSIGREPGTWMPKTWGVSDQRLNLSFTAEFTPSQLFERDDFLRGGYSNAKIFHVIDNEVTLGPSISEGQRVYNVRDGGWQVTRGDGPMGTDMLRFYIEIDEEIHRGDVYVPKGRVYCSCGYFPCSKDGEDGKSIKEAYLKELQEYDAKILRLEEKKATINNPFNFEGIQISREIYKLNREAEKVNERLNLARVREPDKKLLKFSKDGDVGLTKEGGVCCRVDKGLAVEYHILGRFSVASMDRY